MIKKVLTIIWLIGLMVIVSGNINTTVKALGLLDCCYDKGDTRTPNCSICINSGSCQNVPQNCGQAPDYEYGTCYCTATDPTNVCTSWSGYGSCNLDTDFNTGKCFQTRWCQAPTWLANILYQIQQCSCAPPPTEPPPPPTPINGACSTTHYNCDSGTSANNDPSGACSWTWKCNGSDGGSNASCSQNKPSVNGVCAATAYNCASGTSANNDPSGACSWTWNCNGSCGGTNPSCSQNKPGVNGVCAATHYTCTTGASANNDPSGATTWTWNCNGSCGGTNPSCSENKPSCTLTLAAIRSTIAVLDQSALSTTISVVPIGSTISKVDFSELGGHTTPASVTDNSSPFSYLATGVSSGISTVTAVATMNNGGRTCSGSVNINVTNRSPWWQMKDGDVTTNGSLISSIPPTTGLYFDIIGDGGYPGIPAYGSSTNLNTTRTDVSVTGWLANSGYTSTKIFDSNYFLNAIPAGTFINPVANTIVSTDLNTGGTASGGVYYYEYDPSLYAGADLTISGNVNIWGRKIVLITKGADVHINGNINLTDGTGFLLLVAGKNAGGTKGNIFVDIVGPGIGGVSPNLEGIYVADNGFETGSAGTKLWVHGTVAAYGSISLQRDLGADNNTDPAELFEFAPELELLFPASLANRRISWQEVAP